MIPVKSIVEIDKELREDFSQIKSRNKSNFVRYKDYPPINLHHVIKIEKKEVISMDGAIKGHRAWGIDLLLFSKEVVFWNFESEEKRDEVYESIMEQVNIKELGE